MAEPVADRFVGMANGVLSKVQAIPQPDPVIEPQAGIKPRRRMPFSLRLALLVAPLVLVSGFLVFYFVIRESSERVAQNADFTRFEPAVSTVGALVHRLQVERGSSNGFIASKGAKFVTEKTSARAEVDRVLRDWAQIGSLMAEGGFQEQVEALGMLLLRLGNHRTGVDSLALGSTENVAYFTQCIDAALRLVNQFAESVEDREVRQALHVHALLLEGKEAAGKERAHLSSVLSLGSFSATAYQRAVELAQVQREKFTAAKREASPAVAEALGTLGKSATEQTVADQRAHALSCFSAPISGADATRWFADSTARLDALFAIEKQAAAEAFAASRAQLQRAIEQRRHVWTYSLVALLVLLVMAAWQGHALHESVKDEVTSVADELERQSAHLTHAAEEISGASKQLADSTSAQAASLEEASATFEELSAMTGRNAEHAARAAERVGQARKAADQSQSEVDQLAASMQDLKLASDNVVKIVKTIDEIAFQTNLLALNAAVEAARAGEAGAGFAVVAEEVRALAQRSAQAAKDTAEKIETSIAMSQQSIQLSETLHQSLFGIIGGVRETDGLIAEIAQASAEQKKGIDQLAQAVADIDRHTQANAATSEESASTAVELSRNAHVLAASVETLQRMVGHKV